MQEPGADFLSMYLEYTSGTECPVLFNRWSAIAGIGAFLGRGYSLLHGHFPINPNIYCMLMGTPGTRKSTSIKLIKNLLTKAGYETVAADKTSKEKFLVDLAGEENFGRRSIGDDRYSSPSITITGASESLAIVSKPSIRAPTK